VKFAKSLAISRCSDAVSGSSVNREGHNRPHPFKISSVFRGIADRGNSQVYPVVGKTFHTVHSMFEGLGRPYDWGKPVICGSASRFAGISAETGLHHTNHVA
jgi:hypothetical protein